MQLTLAQLTYYIRKTTPVAIIGFLLFAIFFVLIQIIILLIPKRLPPTTPPKPPAFGVLPPVAIQTVSTYSAQLRFEIDTVAGVPETATHAAHVYLQKKQPISFGARNRAESIAHTAVGFVDGTYAQEVIDDIISFATNDATLAINLTTQNFTFRRLESSYEQVVMQSHVPVEQVAIQDAIDVLESFNRYPVDLAKGRQQVSYFQYDSATKTLNKFTTNDGANVVEIDFFPTAYNDVEQVSPTFFTSPHFVLLAYNEKKEPFVLKAQVQYADKTPQDTTSYATYPIKTGDAAYRELQEQKGFVIAGDTRDITQVKIKKMFTAYYDSPQFVEYMQPVYVFIAEGDYVFYVPAILASWTQSQSIKTVYNTPTEPVAYRSIPPLVSSITPTIQPEKTIAPSQSLTYCNTHEDCILIATAGCCNFLAANAAFEQLISPYPIACTMDCQKTPVCVNNICQIHTDTSSTSP